MKKYNCTLVVDDDPISCFINERVIAAAKITDHFHSAHNGKEAIEFIQQNCKVVYKPEKCPDLIFLDLNMPVMNGFEFLEAFGKLSDTEKGKIQIVILTSSTNPVDIEQVQNYSILGYLNKPLTIGSINRLLQD